MWRHFVMFCFENYGTKAVVWLSKQARNENEDKTVEQLELNQKDEKDKQDIEKGKQVTTTL